mmetsp:Transcript_32951/g.54410  ORF Transcript_32951/g.54410 Transcript_32951/m.54410 type:complete len:263 (+) Transcript_32951:237-1025(+)
MHIETVEDVLVTPETIFVKLRLPVFAFAEDLTMKFVELLNRTSEVELVCRAFSKLARMIGLTLVARSILSCNSLAHQTFKLFELTSSNRNWVFHNTPMNLILARWDSLRSLVPEVVLRLHLEQPLVWPIIYIFVVDQTATFAFVFVSYNIFVLQVTIPYGLEILIIIDIVHHLVFRCDIEMVHSRICIRMTKRGYTLFICLFAIFGKGECLKELQFTFLRQLFVHRKFSFSCANVALRAKKPIAFIRCRLDFQRRLAAVPAH